MRTSCALAGLLGVFVTATEAFVASPYAGLRSSSSRRQFSQEVAAANVDAEGSAATTTPSWVKPGWKWDGVSRPATNEKLKDIASEASNWEQEKDRAEVWDDLPNPTDDLAWWEAYTPSQEEIEAAEAGYDWTDEWFERQGMKLVDANPENGTPQ